MSGKMGGPAFPSPYEFVSTRDMGNIMCSEGATLWDYFAAHAPGWLFEDAEQASISTGISVMEIVAHRCADYANAMIAERAKRMEEL